MKRLTFDCLSRKPKTIQHLRRANSQLPFFTATWVQSGEINHATDFAGLPVEEDAVVFYEKGKRDLILFIVISKRPHS